MLLPALGQVYGPHQRPGFVPGFLVLVFSTLASQATYGILLATTIVTALIADFLLMPALVLSFHPFGPEEGREVHASAREAA